jgi:hypothetical protein
MLIGSIHISICNQTFPYLSKIPLSRGSMQRVGQAGHVQASNLYRALMNKVAEPLHFPTHLSGVLHCLTLNMEQAAHRLNSARHCSSRVQCKLDHARTHTHDSGVCFSMANNERARGSYILQFRE